jgi:hypothetical protein
MAAVQYLLYAWPGGAAERVQKRWSLNHLSVEGGEFGNSLDRAKRHCRMNSVWDDAMPSAASLMPHGSLTIKRNEGCGA